MTIIRKFNIEEEKKSGLRTKKTIFFSIIITICLVVMQIWANNTLAIYGSKLESISQLNQTLELENQVLTNKIATSSSLSHIASQSATLGLGIPKSVQYLR